ncbi:MAG TPA: WD40 repeat domain-containing protein [Thermoanaerobaculia bacterium]|nr:WD40 repeat domain-containing protein [Thermoanaerobaculia bacterium]
MRKTTMALAFLASALDVGLLAASSSERPQLPDMRSANVAAIAVAPDGRTVATGERTSLVKLWDGQSRSTSRSLRGHEDRVSALAFSPDSGMLASGSFDRWIRMWDVRSGKETRSLSGHSGHIKSLGFSRDGRSLVSTAADGVRVWDVPSGSLRLMIPTSRGVVAAAFSPDGKVLASSGGDGVLLWNAATGRLIRRLSPPGNELILSLAFSADGRLLAGGGTGRIVSLWDVESGALRARSDSGADAVRAVAFLEDDSSLVIIDRRGARLWRPASGKSHRVVDRGAFSAVAVAPNGRFLAAALGDGEIKLWPSRRVPRNDER